MVVHVDQQGDAAAIDCGQEGIACASGPSLETLEDNQFGVVVTDPANSTDVADLADHLVVGIDNLLDA